MPMKDNMVSKATKATKSGNFYKQIKEQERKGREIVSSNEVAQVMTRRTSAKTNMLKWFDLLSQAYKYATPNADSWRNAAINPILPGQNLGAPVYDLTLPIAHRRLLAKMLIGMIPKGQPWLRFVPGDNFLKGTEEYQEVQKISDALSEVFFKLLDKSRFYLATSEAMSDCLVSTGFMTINFGTKENPFKFNAVTSADVMVEADSEGGYSGIFRDWLQVCVGEIQHIWPEAKRPATKQTHEKVDLYECSYVDWDADEDERYCYLVTTSQQEVLLHTRSKSWPWIYFRMHVLPGEDRGRGPSLEAAPTAATINAALHDEIMAAAFMGNPMYMAASDSGFNPETFTARPGIIVPVQMSQGQWPISAFPQAGNPQFNILVLQDLRQQINDLLYTEPLGPVTGPNMTATESSIRYSENLETFSAMIPRLQNEFFDPVIRRCMFILRELRPEIFEAFDPSVLDQVLSIDGSLIGMSYEIPLVTARGEIGVRRLQNYGATVAGLMGQDLMSASLNPEVLPQFVAEGLGVDAKLIKTQAEIKDGLEAAGKQLEAETAQANALAEEQIQNNGQG